MKKIFYCFLLLTFFVLSCSLIYLAQTFQELGGTLIDCQFETPHLKSMGGRYIDYEEYMRYVQEPLESL